MPEKTTSSIKFLQPRKPSLSPRRKELERSTQRAHSASIAYRRQYCHQRKQASSHSLKADVHLLARHGLDCKPLETLDSTRDEAEESACRAMVAAGGTQAKQDMILPHTTTTLLTSTTPVMAMQGNSDPFDSLAIKLTPDINRIITFTRMAYLPAMRGGNIDQSKFDLSFCRTDMIAARFSSYGFCLARLLPEVTRSDFEQVCLRINGQALHSLRNLIARPQPWSDAHTLLVLEQVAYIILSNSEARRIDAGSSHLQMLMHLTDRLTVNSTYSKSIFRILLTAMHGTLESSCIALKSVDLRCLKWLEVKFGRLGLFVDLVLPSVIEPDKVHDMHTSIRTPFLWSAFQHARELQYVFNLDPAQGIASKDFTATMVYAHQILHQPLMLLNHYLELRDEGIRSEHRSPTSGYETALEALLSLTLLCNMRQTVLSARIPGTNIDLRDASQSLAIELRQAIITCIERFAIAPGCDIREYNEVVFWALFRGAVYERNGCLYATQLQKASNLSADAENESHDSQPWFCKNLSKHARQLGIEDWASAEGVFARFVPSRLGRTAKQSPEALFQQTLDTSRLSEG